MIAESSPVNRMIAKETLTEHNLIFTSTHDGAFAQLTPVTEVEKVLSSVIREYEAYAQWCEREGSQACPPEALNILSRGGDGPFDVVLSSDYLFVHPGTPGAGPYPGVNRLLPSPSAGLQVVAKALMQGVAFVALVWDLHSPESSMRSWMHTGGVQRVGSSLLLIEPIPPFFKGKSLSGKDWKRILDQLISSDL